MPAPGRRDFGNHRESVVRRQGGAHVELGVQGSMHGASVRDLEKSPALFGVQGATQLDYPIDAVELAGLGRAVLAVFGVDPGVAQCDGDALQGPMLARGVHVQGYRGAGAESGEKEVVRRGASVVADGRRFVGSTGVGRQ